MYGLLSSFRLLVLSFAQLVVPIQRLLQKDKLGSWTPEHDAVVRKVLQSLMEHTRLRLPDGNGLFLVEAYHMLGGYSGVLYQEEEQTDSKPKLVPIGCVSTTHTRKLTSEVEHALAATLYCFQKFCNWVATAPSIVVKVPVAGVWQVFSLHGAGACLSGLIAQIAQYPVSFKPSASLLQCTFRRLRIRGVV